MTYLTNDIFDQGVYFDLRTSRPRRRNGGTELLCHGLLGNGVSEVPVTVTRWRDCVDIEFGSGELFSFVEERTIRRMLGEMVQELVLENERAAA
ncbi:hypothetical protein [Geobacter sp. DSM 9736]|uniref:hypothetical protein n=1 Tax=Geobacter sp. DSM 9736 TaxID=1277350 RepID=UPI000B50A4A2|nr:hypothetical protein [Geobacter sp. DSM 9736]SNB46285.1 hypothetical protein SAMN06269301_1733 [Geobacter sp. DSM 9736]